MCKLDRPKLFIRDEKSLTTLFRYFTIARKKQNFTIPSNLYVEAWQHKTSQIHFLTHLFRFQQQLDVFFWSEVNKRIVCMDFNPQFKYSLLTPVVM